MTKSELSSKIGINIRRRRKSLKLSIGAVADRADVAEDYLGHIERGDKTPSVEVLLRIASGLGVGLDDLVGRGAEPEPHGSTTRRLQTLLRGLNNSQKEDVLAILTKLRRPKRVNALRVVLGA